jgi:hypothetical protein
MQVITIIIIINVLRQEDRRIFITAPETVPGICQKSYQVGLFQTKSGDL